MNVWIQQTKSWKSLGLPPDDLRLTAPPGAALLQSHLMTAW
ncbi:hypothetical protein AM1_2439 [Acaryochloris marina MBIC11017]|uniref:Uncharacterized protein n=2 Tax=Acaryochloris marina TaxID=155978 RepID=B0C456_ACAM1|nr:hypothetical protein [Acaryochloris marina]ABW27447.1 hypothetical protein AM1_2439 [Acaryochloris marina MBIC11017]